MSAHQKALDRAKIQLMATRDSAFFTTLCLSLRHVWNDRIPTACCDGRRIQFNPAFFMGLTPAEQVFLLLHETLHAAYLHMIRRGDRNARRWNHAADYVINAQLIERGFTMPKDCRYDAQYAGLSAEEVYDRLPERTTEEVPAGFGLDIDESGGGNPGEDGGNPSGITEAQARALREEMDDILVRASIQSQIANDKPGTIPGDIQLYIDSLTNPKVPWHRQLRPYVSKLVRHGYSFRRPNRRFFPDMLLPSPYSQTPTDIAAAVDTSGSVTDAEFAHFVSETYAIIKQVQPKHFRFLQFDTEIKSVDSVRTVQDLMGISFKGRGGTQIRPVMDWARTHKPAALLVFSDGGFEHVKEDPGVPVIWIIHSNPGFKAPYGKVIHYHFEES